jgi:ubiquitin-protein ligase
MAANRVWKEYKELTKELSRNGGVPDKEISLAPVDDSDIFKWTVRDT